MKLICILGIHNFHFTHTVEVREGLPPLSLKIRKCRHCPKISYIRSKTMTISNNKKLPNQ